MWCSLNIRLVIHRFCRFFVLNVLLVNAALTNFIRKVPLSRNLWSVYFGLNQRNLCIFNLLHDWLILLTIYSLIFHLFNTYNLYFWCELSLKDLTVSLKSTSWKFGVVFSVKSLVLPNCFMYSGYGCPCIEYALYVCKCWQDQRLIH